MVVAQESPRTNNAYFNTTRSSSKPQGWEASLGLSALTTLSLLGVSFWGLTLFHQVPQPVTLLLNIVLAGMVYDNAVLLMGYWLEQSPLLERLNYLRHIIHNACVPLLVIVGFAFLGCTNTPWVESSIANYCSLGVTLALIALGMKDCFSLELVPETVDGVLHYKPKQKSLPIPTILTSLIMAGVGFHLWAHLNLSWVLVGTLVMILGNAIHFESLRKSVSPIVECVFMVALFATTAHLL